MFRFQAVLNGRRMQAELLRDLLQFFVFRQHDVDPAKAGVVFLKNKVDQFSSGLFEIMYKIYLSKEIIFCNPFNQASFSKQKKNLRKLRDLCMLFSSLWSALSAWTVPVNRRPSLT